MKPIPEKAAIHPKADSLNVLEVIRGKPGLLCGAARCGRTGFCRKSAGFGTDHVGYGRCLWHGGRSTGPTTDEGKATVSQNARKHGFYSESLTPEERAVYESQQDQAAVKLIEEIKVLRAKIAVYLKKWVVKYAEGGEAAVKVAARRISESDTEDGIAISTTTFTYEAGTIEDRHLMQALDKLGRLVERQSKLDPNVSDNLVDDINQELRAASHGRLMLSWGNRRAQERIIEPGNAQ